MERERERYQNITKKVKKKEKIGATVYSKDLSQVQIGSFGSIAGKIGNETISK